MSRHPVSNLAIASFFSIGLCCAAHAEEEGVQLSGVIYSHWGADLNAMTNEFGIDRVYLNATRNVGEDFAIRVTTDVRALEYPVFDEDSVLPGSMDTRTRLFLKYAYLEWKNSLPGVKLRFGMAGTPWVAQHEKFWAHRWVQRSFSDKHGVLNSSDVGVHALGSDSDGLVTWAAALLNGTGSNTPENDASKTAQLRVTLNPLAKRDRALPISGFVSYDPVDIGQEGAAGITYAAALGYKVEAGLVWLEYLGRSEGDRTSAGYSVSTVFHLGDFGHAIARYDSWDVNTHEDQDAENSVLVGLSHTYAEHVSMGVFYEHTLPDLELDDGQSLFVRMQAGF
jgi:hypothetical protein